MSYQFTYLYATDTWHLGYTPDSPIGYPEPEYELPGVVPEGDWTLYAEMYGASDGAAVGLVVEMEDGERIANLATWNWPLGYSEDGGENTYVTKGTGQVWLKIEYHAEAGELHLFSATTEGVWQSLAVALVATPVDTGLLLRYASEDTDASGYLTGVRLLEGLEEGDGHTDLQLAPTITEVPPVVQPLLTLGNEPTVYGLMGAPFGDLEFDVGKSARWLEYFSDKMYVTDVNLGDPRYWIVNWAITFPDAEHGVTNINFFERPADFRKEQFRQADKQYHIEDDAWVFFVDGTEGLSFDNSSLPNDYDFNPFMSFIYREIARAEAAVQTSVVFPFFVFLRSAEVQNVTYDHFANFDDGSFSLLQPISVPYYLAYQGLRRMFRADVLKNPAFNWSQLDTPAAPSAGVKAQIISYAYAHWNLQDIPPGATEPPPLSEANDDGFRMRKRISQVRPIASLGVGAWDPAADPAGVPGPWAKYITTNVDPTFEPITDTPVTDPHASTLGIKTPLYDCVIRLNMRDGVWYEGDVSGNTPMMWDAENGKWQTSYDPDTWPDYGVRAGDNPMYNDPQSPLPPVPTPE